MHIGMYLYLKLTKQSKSDAFIRKKFKYKDGVQKRSSFSNLEQHPSSLRRRTHSRTHCLCFLLLHSFFFSSNITAVAAPQHKIKKVSQSSITMLTSNNLMFSDSLNKYFFKANISVCVTAGQTCFPVCVFDTCQYLFDQTKMGKQMCVV